MGSDPPLTSSRARMVSDLWVAMGRTGQPNLYHDQSWEGIWKELLEAVRARGARNRELELHICTPNILQSDIVEGHYPGGPITEVHRLTDYPE